MIITYHKRLKQGGQRRSRHSSARAKDGIPYERARSYGRSYEVSGEPPHSLFSPRGIGSGNKRAERPETRPEGRTLASGNHPDEGLARRRSPSSPSSKRGLQHHHHCRHHHHHHAHPSHCNIRNPSGLSCVLRL